MLYMQEVNEMWAGLGYYRRARFLLEVLYALIIYISVCELYVVMGG